MNQTPNLRPRVTEPMRGDGSIGVAVELEFYERVRGLNGDTLILDLSNGATMDQADALVKVLADLVARVRVSNPKG